MAVKTAAELRDWINGNIITNGTQSITGQMLNEGLIDIVDSWAAGGFSAVENGLSIDASKLGLGGPLTKNTSIDPDVYLLQIRKDADRYIKMGIEGGNNVFGTKTRGVNGGQDSVMQLDITATSLLVRTGTIGTGGDPNTVLKTPLRINSAGNILLEQVLALFGSGQASEGSEAYSKYLSISDNGTVVLKPITAVNAGADNGLTVDGGTQKTYLGGSIIQDTVISNTNKMLKIQQNYTGTYRTLPVLSLINVAGGTSDAAALLIGNNATLSAGTSGYLIKHSAASTELINFGIPKASALALESNGNMLLDAGANNIYLKYGNSSLKAVFAQGQVALADYPDTRDDGPTTKALYVTATGNLRYGTVTPAGGGGDTLMERDMDVINADYGYVVPVGWAVDMIVVIPTANSNYKIGTTNGGEQLSAMDSILAAEPRGHSVFVAATTAPKTIYINGFLANTTLIVFRRKIAA